MSILSAPIVALALGITAPSAARPLAWLTLSNGVTIRYLDQGDPAGQPIVLVHGFSGSWQSFERVLPLIPDRYRVIAVDLRGHGGSDRPGSGYAVADLADDVSRLLMALELDQVTLVGHSLGSFVVREVARRTPRRVKRMVLIGSAAFATNEGTTELRNLIASFGEQIPIEFIDEFQRSTFALPLPDDFVAGVMAASATVPPRVWRGVIDGLIEFDDRTRLRQLRLPTLLMWGEKDQVFNHADQESLLDAIPGSRLVAYRSAGHAPHWEVPDAFVDDLLGFLEEDQERR